MKRYEFEIRSALVPTIKEVNKLMNDFGYDGHAVGWKIGTVRINITDDDKIESLRMKLEDSMNEVLKEKNNPECWLTNVGYVENKEEL